MTPETMIDNARLLCLAAHSAIGQVRKYTAEPYWVHPFAVADLVRTAENRTPEMIAAAYLHDVLEDTKIDPAIISQYCGMVVLNLVGQVTDVSRPEHGNRAQRKEIDRRHLACATPAGKTIKLADLIDNTASIVRFDPEFARVYLAEKRTLLDVLKGGDPLLFARAQCVLRKGLQSLGEQP